MKKVGLFLLSLIVAVLILVVGFYVLPQDSTLVSIASLASIFVFFYYTTKRGEKKNAGATSLKMSKKNIGLVLLALFVFCLAQGVYVLMTFDPAAVEIQK